MATNNRSVTVTIAKMLGVDVLYESHLKEKYGYDKKCPTATALHRAIVHCLTNKDPGPMDYGTLSKGEMQLVFDKLYTFYVRQEQRDALRLKDFIVAAEVGKQYRMMEKALTKTGYRIGGIPVDIGGSTIPHHPRFTFNNDEYKTTQVPMTFCGVFELPSDLNGAPKWLNNYNRVVVYCLRDENGVDIASGFRPVARFIKEGEVLENTTADTLMKIPFHLQLNEGAIETEYATEVYTPLPSRCPRDEPQEDGSDEEEDIPQHKQEIAAVLRKLKNVPEDEEVKDKCIYNYFVVDKNAIVRFQGPRSTIQKTNMLGYDAAYGTISNFRITVQEVAPVPYVDGRTGEPSIMEMYWDLSEIEPAYGTPVAGTGGHWDCT